MSRAAAYVVPDLPRTATVSSVRFFFIAQVVLLIPVLVGFSPTFYLRPLFKVHPLPAVLYVHGASVDRVVYADSAAGMAGSDAALPVASPGRVRGGVLRGAGSLDGVRSQCLRRRSV